MPIVMLVLVLLVVLLACSRSQPRQERVRAESETGRIAERGRERPWATTGPVGRAPVRFAARV